MVWFNRKPQMLPWSSGDASNGPSGPFGRRGGGAWPLLLLSSRSAYSVTSAGWRLRWSALIASALRRCRRSAAGQHTSQYLLMAGFILMEADWTASQSVRTSVWILWLWEEKIVWCLIKIWTQWKCCSQRPLQFLTYVIKIPHQGFHLNIVKKKKVFVSGFATIFLPWN